MMKVQKTLLNYFIQSNNNSVVDLFIKDLRQLFFCLDSSKGGMKAFAVFESRIVLFILSIGFHQYFPTY